MFLNLAILLIICITFEIIVFLLAKKLKRHDILDIAWGLSFIFVTFVCMIIFQSFNILSIIFLFIITIWGVRLSSHIYFRNIGKHDDNRYIELTKNIKNNFELFIKIYLPQLYLMLIICSPILFTVISKTNTLEIINIFGILIWIFGFIFESTADLQLKKFKSDISNKGKIMDSGLWAYSRHPNYFGEVVQWWGIWTISLSTIYSFFTFIGPATITYLILFVSGIPLLEKSKENNELYIKYKSRVNKFIPWFQKR